MNSFLNKLFLQKKLKLVEPSKEIRNSYFEKSESNLDSAKLLFENNKFEESVALIYFSSYNLVLSLLFAVGIKCENHSATANLLKELFELDNSFLIEAKKERIDKQYYTNFSITKKEIEQEFVFVEEFNRNLKAFILKLNNLKIEFYRNKFKELVKWKEN